MGRDEALLLDIRSAARSCVAFTRGMNLAEFLAHSLVRSAVLHQIMIIGEAVNHLSDSFKVEHNTIPWAKIVGMRNQIVHGYRDVDFVMVWDTIQVNVPELLNAIEPLLPPGASTA